MASMKLICQGAEANIYLNEKDNTIIKDRIRKTYRITELDNRLRKSRTRSESKLIGKAHNLGILTPKIISTEQDKITMDYIPGKRLKDTLNKENIKTTMTTIGKIIATLHTNNIIHGDLTTSNFIQKEKDIYLIDFGLGSISTSTEKKAVDLHLFEEAMESTHSDLYQPAINSMQAAYKKNYQDSEQVLKRLEQIRKRGRYVKR